MTSDVTSYHKKRIALAIIVIHGGLLAWGAVRDGPTVDEVGHLAAAIAHFQMGRFDLYAVNPPLVRTIAALPLYFAGIDVDWRGYDPRIGSRSEFTIGLDIIRRNPDRAFQLLTIARWFCIPISLLGAYLCLRWASELYGFAGGLLALCLWCFSPSIIANGQQIIPDVDASVFAICAGYCLWRWLRRPRWGRASIAGISLGLGLLSKMTLLAFVIVWPLMTMFWVAVHESDRTARALWRILLQLAVVLLLALFTVNLGYAFEEVGIPLGDFEFFSQTLSGSNAATAGEPVPANRFTNSCLATLPVLLPKNYVLGVDWIRHELEARKWSYLRGEWRFGGWWYYYLYALLVKTPIGTLVLILLALGASLVPLYHTNWKDEMVLLVPSGVLLILASSQTGFNHHLRYVLPTFPFIFVWCGKLGLAFSARHYALSAITASALAWSVTSSLMVYPHSLSYFNEFAGGLVMDTRILPGFIAAMSIGAKICFTLNGGRPSIRVRVR